MRIFITTRVTSKNDFKNRNICPLPKIANFQKNKKIAFSMSQWAYMPKIRFVGQTEWRVANTKIKKEKTKNAKVTLKSSKIKIFNKTCFFALSMPHWAHMPKIRFVGRMEWPVANTEIKKEKTKNAPKNVNFQNFEK